jgi:hypothetical protein
MRKLLLAAALWLSAAPAFGQQYQEIPPHSLVGNLGFMSNPGYAVTIPELVGALSAQGLALDQLDRVGDSNYTIPAGDRVVATFVPFTTSRTWTLPAAGNTTAGHPIMVVDLAGGVTGSNTLVIARAGTDTINGSGASLTISVPFGAYEFVSDGVSSWNAQPLGGISIAPCGGLTSSVSAACAQSPITAFGTLSAAACVNAQSGTSYAIQNGDRARLITASNAAAQAYTIAQAGAASAFQSGWFVDVHNISTNPAGIVTITPTTSTINGASTLPIHPGQSVRIISDGTNYQTAFATVLPSITASLLANVAMNNTGNYFDGPSVAQGSTGVWRATSTVTLFDTANSATMDCKLWDGTTVIASARANTTAASFPISMSLSGKLASPVGNLRVSCRDEVSTSGVISFNSSGNSMDSTITADRIQ